MSDRTGVEMIDLRSRRKIGMKPPAVRKRGLVSPRLQEDSQKRLLFFSVVVNIHSIRGRFKSLFYRSKVAERASEVCRAIDRIKANSDLTDGLCGWRSSGVILSFS